MGLRTVLKAKRKSFGLPAKPEQAFALVAVPLFGLKETRELTGWTTNDLEKSLKIGPVAAKQALVRGAGAGVRFKVCRT